MENVFIVRYRRALRELQEAYRLQYALVDESDALRTLAYQQAHTAEKAILKNHKRGRAFLISRLTECLDEEPHAWKVTQHIRREIEEMEANRYDSEISDEQNHALYLVIEDAIICLLAVLGSQYPNKLTAIDIPTYRGIIPASKLILKFGPVPLQRIVRQQLKAAVGNPAPATTEPSQPGSPTPDKGCPHLGDTLDTAAPVAPTVADLDETLGILKLGYTKTSLDNLLRSLHLIEDAPSLDAKMDTKPAQWVAVITALNKRITKNKTKVFLAFSQRYGEGIGKLRAFQDPYNDNNEDAALCYSRAQALLGKA